MRYSIFIIFILMSCDSKFVRKNIEDENINIKWYYYSYINNNSPDIIEVTKSDSCVEIFRADEIIRDVTLNKDTIGIKTYPPRSGVVYTESMFRNVFGYVVIIDSTSTDEEIKIPHGIKE